MREFVGVTSFLPNAASVMLLKRDALIFNRFAMPHYDAMLRILREEADENSKFLANEIESLFDTGIVFEPPVIAVPVGQLEGEDEFYSCVGVVALQSIEMLRHILQNEPEQFPGLDTKKRSDFLESMDTGDFITSLSEALDSDPRIIRRIDPQRSSDVEDSMRIISEYQARAISLQLREQSNMDAYPIITSHLHSSLKSQADKSDVVQIVVNLLPRPDDSVSWDQIFDYRRDPDSAGKFLALRNWMNDIAKGNLTPAEIEEKLEYLIDQYKRHLKVHKLKTSAGALETVVVTGAEFLENLLKFNWGKAAKGLFSLRHQRIALMEGELTVPGNEIAYIVNAVERFS